MNQSIHLRVLPVLAGVCCIVLLGGSPASAAIIKIQQAASCSVYGLDASPATAQGGVHCDPNYSGSSPYDPFSLTKLLNGGIPLYVGDSQTPSWNFVNDTGTVVTSLTLYYSGALAAGSFIDMQLSGAGANYFTSCTSVDANGVTRSDGSCGTGDISAKPQDGLVLPLKMTWTATGTDQLGIDQVFNIGTASFAHAGEDAGCIAGTPTCQSVPDGGSAAAMFGMAILGFAAVRRWLR